MHANSDTRSFSDLPAWQEDFADAVELFSEGENTEAIDLMQRTAERANNAECWDSLGKMQSKTYTSPREIGHIALDRAAVQSFQKASDLDPYYRVQLYEQLNINLQYEEALKVLMSLIADCPSDDAVAFVIGHLQESKGELQLARRYYRQALRNNPCNGTALESLTRLVKNPDLKQVKRLEALMHSGEVPEQALINFHLAISIIYERNKRYDQAFGEIHSANLLAKHCYDHSRTDKLSPERLLEKHVAPFDNIDLKQTLSRSTAQPIFIVGMPRSGSTILEQALTCHQSPSGDRDIAACGEIPYLIKIWQMISADPDTLEDVLNDPEQLTTLADVYMQKAAEHIGNNEYQHYVDKFIQNYFSVGLIQRLFPQAVIIYIDRNKADMALSLYKRDFGDQINTIYTYDLDEIKKQQELCEQVMATWAERLPEDRIVRVQYEDFVADPNRTLSGIFQRIGLAWDPSMLDNLKKINDFVPTSTNARGKISNSSVGSARNYAKFHPILRAS